MHKLTDKQDLLHFRVLIKRTHPHRKVLEVWRIDPTSICLFSFSFARAYQLASQATYSTVVKFEHPWGFIGIRFDCQPACAARCCTYVFANEIDACRYDDSLFVEANTDRSGCVHVANGALQRQENIKFTLPAFHTFFDIANLACDYIAFAKLKVHVILMLYHRVFLAFAFLSESHHIVLSRFVFFFFLEAIFCRVQSV